MANWAEEIEKERVKLDELLGAQGRAIFTRLTTFVRFDERSKVLNAINESVYEKLNAQTQPSIVEFSDPQDRKAEQ